MDKQEALTRLQKQLDQIPKLKKRQSFSNEFKKWRRDTQVTIQRIFGENTRHIKDFDDVSYSLVVFTTMTPDHEFDEKFHEGLDEAASILESLIDEVKEFWGERVQSQNRNYLSILERLCTRFHFVARQLHSRHNNRDTLHIKDEYDVQDLLHALLALEFDDIRPEEWTPSYAGGGSRMDFLLKPEQIVVEVKKTRSGLGASELGEQLIVDIQKYKRHPDCKTLVCFVYDPEGQIDNPRGIENDLSGDKEGLTVRVIITPKGL
jgi:hypothetical protein